MASEEHDDGSDESYVVSDDTDATPPSKSHNLRERNSIEYAQERVDTEFVGEKGYAHFGRTRKGGDSRPRGTQRKPKATNSVTLLNFFSMGGQKPKPIPKTRKRTLQQSPSPPKTRTKWGRPARTDNLENKIAEFKRRVARTETAGGCSRPPTKRATWNGTVCVALLEIIGMACTFLMLHMCARQMIRKVATLTSTFLTESEGEEQKAALLLSNFLSQRCIQPFVFRENKTPTEVFGKNVAETVKAVKASKMGRHSGTRADILRRNLLAGGAHGPLSQEKISLRELSRICGYGNNPARIGAVNDAKKTAETIEELLDNVHETAKRKPRCDKLEGDPIWTKAWHEFTAVKKGQAFRSKMVYHERVQDEATQKMVWKSTWLRHPKRYMVHKIEEVHQMVLKWPPYLEWREGYLRRNPRLPRTWHVGWKRLYKEKCFCIDEKV